MKLTNTQHAVLSTALQRDDGTLKLPANLKGGAVQKTVAKLLAEGVAEEIPARGSMPVWRKDKEGRPIALQITVAGLAAIQGGPPGLKKGEPAAEKERPSRSKSKTASGKPKRSAGAAALSTNIGKKRLHQAGQGDCAAESS